MRPSTTVQHRAASILRSERAETLAGVGHRLNPLALMFLASCSLLSINGKPASGSPSGEPSQQSSQGAAPTSGGRASGPSSNAHDKMEVMGLKIGMTIEDRPGFTCDKRETTELDVHCVKFTDPRCEGRPTNLGSKKYNHAVPAGCFMDLPRTTYLDNQLMLPVLTSIELVGTESVPSKIYKIIYTFGADDVTVDSKLGKALTAKYGAAYDPKNAPVSMIWKTESTRLTATCRNRDGSETSTRAAERAKGEFCEIVVEDPDFDQLERSQQEGADAKTRQNAATAPKL